MTESSQTLEIDSGMRHIDWVMAEAEAEVLTDLLASLWLETHSLVADLLSLVQQNARERRAYLSRTR